MEEFPKDSQIQVKVSDFKAAKDDYRFYSISMGIILVRSFIVCLIPNFEGVYKLMHHHLSLASILAIIGGTVIEFFVSSALIFQVSILGIISGTIGIVFLFALDKMAARLKDHNLTKVSSWVWALAAFIPVVFLIVIFRVFILARRLIMKLS